MRIMKYGLKVPVLCRSGFHNKIYYDLFIMREVLFLLILSIISGSYYGFGPYDIMDSLLLSTEDHLGLVVAR